MSLFIRSLSCTFFGAFLVFGFNACDGGFQSLSPGAPGSASLISQGPVDGVELITTADETSINLAEEKEITVNVASRQGYAGTVNLSIDRSELDVLDTLGAVEVSLDRESVQLSAGGVQEVKVSVKTKSSAPSFDLTAIKILAEPTDERSNPTETEHNVQVNPVVELKMLGELDNQAERFNKPEEMEFAIHQQGLTIRFMNMDQNGNHIIHGNRAIPHGDRQNPLPASVDGVQPGGVYTVNINAAERRSGGYYYHNFENGGAERAMLFNRSTAELQEAQALRAVASVVGAKKVIPLQVEEADSAPCHGGSHDTE